MFRRPLCYELNRAATHLAKQAVAEERLWLRSQSLQESNGGTERVFQAVSQSPQQLKSAAGVLGTDLLINTATWLESFQSPVGALMFAPPYARDAHKK